MIDATRPILVGQFIPGIEVSAYVDRSIHVLGYGVDPDSTVLTEFSERRVAARFERMRRMVEKLDALGVSIDYDEVVAIAGEGSIARPHLARALVDAGHVEDIEEAFQRYISPGGPAYIATTWPRVPDAIDIVRQAGGAAVLAHPGIYDRDEQIPAWARLGLVGLEVRHPKHDAAAERRYAALAADLELIPTASSDFHGPDHVSANHFGDVELDGRSLDRLRDAIAAA